jgi:hypothetical protein
MKNIYKAFINLFLSLFFFFSFVSIVVAITLYFNNNLRHLTFRSFNEAPAAVFYLLIRKDVISRNFDGAAKNLQRQLDFVTWVRPSNSVMIPGLIDNTRLVVRLASSEKDWVALAPYLKNLAETADSVHLTHLWLGRALSKQNPRTALIHLEKAVALSGPDPEPFRHAIKIAYENGFVEAGLRWCKSYQSLQFGGTRTYDYNNRFLETSARRVALRVEQEDGSIQYYGHQGLIVSSENTLEFSFEKPLRLYGLALEFGIVPGYEIKVDSVTIRTQGGLTEILADQLNIFAENGYYADGGFLTVSQDGEVLEFSGLPEGATNVHAVEVKITMTRGAFSNQILCDGSLQ